MATFTDVQTDTVAAAETKAGGIVTENTNWNKISSSTEFRALIEQKRRNIPWILFPPLVLFFTIMLLAGFARPLLTEKFLGILPLGYLLVIATYITCWISALRYVHVANTTFDGLARDVIVKIQEGGQS